MPGEGTIGRQTDPGVASSPGNATLRAPWPTHAHIRQMAIRRHAGQLQGATVKEVNQRRLIKSNAGAALGRGASRTGSPRAQRRCKAKARAGGTDPGRPGPLTPSITWGLRPKPRREAKLEAGFPNSPEANHRSPPAPRSLSKTTSPRPPPRADATRTHRPAPAPPARPRMLGVCTRLPCGDPTASL